MTPYRKIQDDAAFHAARLKGVGSSDIATLAGLNKRWWNDYTVVATGETVSLQQTPLTLYRVKRGEIVQGDVGERAQWGHHLEGLILREWVRTRWPEYANDFYTAYLERRDYGEYKVFTEAQRPDRAYCMAHSDLLVVPPPGPTDPDAIDNVPLIIEAKSSSMMAGKRREGAVFEGYDEDDLSMMGLPDKVFLQVQWQLYVYDIPEAYVPVLIDTSTFRTYGPVKADPRTQEKCIALAERFWDCVTTGREPQPQAWGDVLDLWPTLDKKTAVVSGDLELKAREMIARGVELKASAKRIDDEIDDIKDALGVLAGLQSLEALAAEQGVEVSKVKLPKPMRSILSSADGDTLAKFYDKSAERLSLGLSDIAKKKEPLTPEEKQILAIDKKLRKMGLYKSSSWREVRY
jgi:predicted phage-related endonuclease